MLQQQQRISTAYVLTLLVGDVDPADGCVDVAGLQRLSGPLTSPLRLFVTHLLFNRVFQSLTTHLRTSDCTSPLPPSSAAAPPSSALY